VFKQIKTIQKNVERICDAIESRKFNLKVDTSHVTNETVLAMMKTVADEVKK
jgi:hypothetical protein